MTNGQNKLIDFKRILIIRMSAFGDIILTTPLIRALKKAYPDAKIDFLTKKQFEPLLIYNPHLERVIGFDTEQGFWGLLKLIRSLKKEKYDLVVDLHINPRSILVRYFCGARLKRRYLKRSFERRLLKWFRINLLKNSQPVAERYFSALEDFGIEPDGLPPEIYFSEKEKAKADEIISSACQANYLIGLAPGASRYTKRWPAERFAWVGAKLAGELGAKIFILGGNEDKGVSYQVSSAMKAMRAEEPIDLTGRLNILESSALVKRLHLLISNDSALMHIATAVNTPVLAIFGSTSKELGFFPYSKKAKVVEVELECRPCSLHGKSACPKGHFKCMLEISPEKVYQTAKEMLLKK